MANKHFGNGPPRNEMAVYDTNGNLVINAGRQADGTYSATFFDTSGNPVVVLGQTTDSHVGIVQYDSNGVELVRSDERGLISPPLAVMMRGFSGGTSVAAADSLDTTNASFEILWIGEVPKFVHQGLQLRIAVQAPVGTTGEMKIAIVRFTDSIALATSNVYTIASGANVSVTLTWLHGVALPGPRCFVELLARRTGGAGNVTITRPTGCYFVGPDGMTGSGGAWT